MKRLVGVQESRRRAAKRSIEIGSRVGIQHAWGATVMIKIETDINVSRSLGVTPYNELCSRRVRASEPKTQSRV
jgi:hypothetical protein